MDYLLRKLNESHQVLDLGCGVGSFDYSVHRCRILGLDASFPDGVEIRHRLRLPHVGFVQGVSHQLPFADGAFDLVLCNNTLEHFQDLEEVLIEINRVTHSGSRLYVAVPNGFGFDDALYRFLLKGGGHLNRFGFEGLRKRVEDLTRFRLRSFRRLFSSFIYLNRPRREVLIHLPQRMRLYYHLLPPSLVSAFMFALNFVVRHMDRVLGTQAGQYGWAFYFETASGALEEQTPHINVCMRCGAGHSRQFLSREKALLRGWPRLYRCPSCSRLNLYF